MEKIWEKNNILKKIDNALEVLDKDKDSKGFYIVTSIKPFLHNRQNYIIKIDITKEK